MKGCALIVIVSVVALAVLTLFVSFPVVYGYMDKRNARKYSKEMITLLDEYKSAHGIYPGQIREIAIADTTGNPKIHYLREDSVRYFLYYFTSFDRYWRYDSDKGVWENTFR